MAVVQQASVRRRLGKLGEGERMGKEDADEWAAQQQHCSKLRLQEAIWLHEGRP